MRSLTEAPDDAIRVGASDVFGLPVDAHTRCVHYASPLDVIAIRFACCERFHPCHACHEAVADHDARVWPRHEFDTHAVLCGICGTTMSISRYLEAAGCDACHAPFNPGCSLHHHLYFSITATESPR